MSQPYLPVVPSNVGCGVGAVEREGLSVNVKVNGHCGVTLVRSRALSLVNVAQHIATRTRLPGIEYKAKSLGSCKRCTPLGGLRCKLLGLVIPPVGMKSDLPLSLTMTRVFCDTGGVPMQRLNNSFQRSMPPRSRGTQ